MAAKPLSATNLIDDANLVSYYPLTGNSTDYKGNANGSDTAITYQTSPIVNADFVQSANFVAASSSKINATRTTGLSGSFTIMGWVRYTATGAENTIVESHVASYNNYWAYLGIGGANKFYVNMYDGTNNPFIVGATTLSTSTWYQFAMVRDTAADKIRCYVNGAEDGTEVTDTTTSTPTYSSFDIGRRTGGGGSLTGNLDDLSVFSRALTTAEISGYFNGTLPGPSSAAGTHRGFFNLVNQPA